MKPSENPRPNGHDPLEERLRRTTFRRPATAWRDEILAAAQTTVAAEATRRSPAGRPEPRLVTSAATTSWPHLLLRWLRGIPTEWTAAAALWALIVALNSLSGPAPSSDGAGSSSFAHVSPEQRDESIREAIAFRRQLLGELQGGEAADALPPENRREADRPRRQLNFHGTNGLAATSA